MQDDGWPVSQFWTYVHRLKNQRGGGWPRSRWWDQMVPLQQDEYGGRQAGRAGVREGGGTGGSYRTEHNGIERID